MAEEITALTYYILKHHKVPVESYEKGEQLTDGEIFLTDKKTSIQVCFAPTVTGGLQFTGYRVVKLTEDNCFHYSRHYTTIEEIVKHLTINPVSANIYGNGETMNFDSPNIDK